MSILTPSIRITRVAAILAMAVLVSGKTVHFHQESDDCCAVSGTAQQASTAETCPFGCTHHATNESDPAGDRSTDDSSKESHDEHNCAVCQLLAQSPSCPVLLSLPDQSDVVAELIPLHSEFAIAGVPLSAQPRGPPHAA